jgi:hypothetical protein
MTDLLRSIRAAHPASDTELPSRTDTVRWPTGCSRNPARPARPISAPPQSPGTARAALPGPSAGSRTIRSRHPAPHQRAEHPVARELTICPQILNDHAERKPLCAGAQRPRLLSVTDWLSASLLGWQSSRLSADHVAWPRPLDRARGTRPCPRQKRDLSVSAGPHIYTGRPIRHRGQSAVCDA